jgi:hypothetical protein
MKTTPAPPSHVRLDTKFGIEKFESFLKSNDPNETKAIFAGKSNLGVMLLHRLPTESDSKLARLSYFLRFGSERNELRQEIKGFLKDQGIALTADIRKALPSRFSTGSATGLIDALKKAPVEEKFVVSSFGSTLENLDWENLKNAKNLSRANSIGMGSSARASGLNFSAQAKSIAAEVISEIKIALNNGDTGDEAMVVGYTALINQVQKIEINASFSNVVQGMHKEVDRVMAEKLKNTAIKQHQAIKDFGETCKKNIIPSLVLRTLNPAIINELAPESQTALKADGTETMRNKVVDVIKLTQQLQKQLNEEANGSPMTDKNTQEKISFPKFSTLAAKYNAELSLTSAIEAQIFKPS